MGMLRMAMKKYTERYAVTFCGMCLADFMHLYYQVLQSEHSLLLLQFLERLQSHRLLAKLKKAFLDMGILVGDVAVIPKVQASLFLQL